MRLSGDSAGCEQVADALLRAATEVARQATGPRSSVAWSGRAALAWWDTRDARARRLLEVADALAATSRVLRRHAHDLTGLQQRAAALTAAAQDAGLQLDADGFIAPVPVPCVAATPAQEAERAQALAQQHERERLLTRVAQLRRDERDLHVRTTQALHVTSGSDAPVLPPSPRPSYASGVDLIGRGDLPGVALSAVEAGVGVADARSAAGSRAPLVRGAARAAPLLRAMPGIGFLTGVVGDMALDGRSADEAVARNGIATAAGLGATAMVGAAIVSPTAPVVIAGVVVGSAAAKVTTVIWDLIRGRQRGTVGPQRAASPSPVPRPTRTATPRAPQPVRPAPTPQPTPQPPPQPTPTP